MRGNGASGVDVFYVISGFLMIITSRNLIGAPDGWSRFAIQRLIRVIPMYWLAITKLKKVYAILFYFAKFIPGSARTLQGCRIRVALLRLLAASCGREFNLLAKSGIGAPYNLTIGDNSAIGLGCYLSCFEKITLGKRVLMGPGVMIYTSNHVWHPIKLTYFRQGETLGRVTIGDDAWIGAHAIILPGVVIGMGCMVAVGAVVTRSIADYSTVAGVPAKQINIKPPFAQAAFS